MVRAYRYLAVSGRSGAAYNVCTGTSVAIREIAERLLDIAGQGGPSDRSPTGQMRLVSDPALHRPVDLAESCGDPTAIRTDTGWRPEMSLDRTLADLLEFWRGRLRREPEAD